MRIIKFFIFSLPAGLFTGLLIGSYYGIFLGIVVGSIIFLFIGILINSSILIGYKTIEHFKENQKQFNPTLGGKVFLIMSIIITIFLPFIINFITMKFNASGSDFIFLTISLEILFSVMLISGYFQLRKIKTIEDSEYYFKRNIDVHTQSFVLTLTGSIMLFLILYYLCGLKIGAFGIIVILIMHIAYIVFATNKRRKNDAT